MSPPTDNPYPQKYIVICFCASYIYSSHQLVTLSHCVQEKEKRREELKRLKNLKMREILDKVEKLKDVAGDTVVGFTEQDVEGEFNEREYDEMMKVRCVHCLKFFKYLCICYYSTCVRMEVR